MSARRELLALWARCETLRGLIGPYGGELSADARRRLDDAADELASSRRRLGSAAMLTSGQARDLERALDALGAARSGTLPAATAVARYASALEEVAAGFRIVLPTRPTGPLGAAVATSRNGPEPAPPGSDGEHTVASEAVEALAFVTSVAARGGHRLGGFSGSGSDAGYRFIARCADCGGQVSVHGHADVWSFSPVEPCAHIAAAPAHP